MSGQEMPWKMCLAMNESCLLSLVAENVPELEQMRVHVWQASLDHPDSKVEDFYETLAKAEQERASGFLLEGQRRDFVVCRGILRIIMAGYLGINPAEVEFGTAPQGKPILKTGCGNGLGVKFSLSHSGRLALFAVSMDCDIGVDIECMSALRDIDGIAQGFFSQREYAQYQTLPPKKRREAFFRCWTRKEACLKALGTGFSLSPNCFTVSLLPDEPAALLEDNAPGKIGRLELFDITTFPGYCAALAFLRPTLLSN